MKPKEKRVRWVFIGMLEVAELRCGPAHETLPDSFSSLPEPAAHDLY